MRKAGGAVALAVASVFVLVSCSRTVSLRPSQLPRLQALAAEREVRVETDEGEEVTLSRGTKLTLFVPGFPPIETRPDRMGFSPTSLRLGTAFELQAPTVAYSQIARVDARVRNMTTTLLAIFIPIGVFLTIVLVCAADDGCGPGT